MSAPANEAARDRAGGPLPIAELVERFVAAFNTDDLDEVMSFFAEGAVYEPGNGRTHHGRAAIREAFQPQFSNAFGTMRFVVTDRVIDENARKATIRWVCRHDLDTVKPVPQRWLFKAMFGARAGWYGTDTFHFDERGQVAGKFSYANYGRRPHLRRDLGRAPEGSEPSGR